MKRRGSDEGGQSRAPGGPLHRSGSHYSLRLSRVARVLAANLESQSRADVTGKLNVVEFLPFAAILWGATLGFGIVGAAAARSLPATADALVMPWLSGMKKRGLLSLLRPGALLVASLTVARLPGFAGALAASASFALGYLFSEDLRNLILAQVNRARIVLVSASAVGT